MIYVVKEKRLNGFKQVHCAKPRDLFARYGKREVIPTDSNLEESIPMNLSKLDSIEYLERYDEMMSSRTAGTYAQSSGKDNVSSSDDSSD